MQIADRILLCSICVFDTNCYLTISIVIYLDVIELSEDLIGINEAE